MDRLNLEGLRVDKAKPTAVALDGVTVAFGLADAQPYIAVEQARLSVADGEFDAAQCRRWPA
jgi:NitT/TauT family transport system ATP-binding protein